MLPALADTPGVEIVAVASRDPTKAVRFTDRFGGKPVEGYAALLDRDDIDAVYLPLPNGLHYEWIGTALTAGKHVLAEKPLTTTAADTADLLRLAAARGVVLREKFTFLHHPVHATVRELLAAGRIGEPRHFTGAFCFPPLPAYDVRYRVELGGGALLDAGVYPVRAAQLLFGDDLEVTGAVLRVDQRTGIDLSGSALLVSGTGMIITAEFGFEHSYASHYQLWGSAGRLFLDRAFTPPAAHQPVLRIDEQNHAEELVLPAAHQFARSAAAFADAVRANWAGADPADSANIGTAAVLRTAELVDAIRNTAHTVIVAGR
jgi:NDP-hexose-3-ketoreductase